MAGSSPTSPIALCWGVKPTSSALPLQHKAHKIPLSPPNLLAPFAVSAALHCTACKPSERLPAKTSALLQPAESCYIPEAERKSHQRSHADFWRISGAGLHSPLTSWEPSRLTRVQGVQLGPISKERGAALTGCSTACCGETTPLLQFIFLQVPKPSPPSQTPGFPPPLSSNLMWKIVWEELCLLKSLHNRSFCIPRISAPWQGMALILVGLHSSLPAEKAAERRHLRRDIFHRATRSGCSLQEGNAVGSLHSQFSNSQ